MARSQRDRFTLGQLSTLLERPWVLSICTFVHYETINWEKTAQHLLPTGRYPRPDIFAGMRWNVRMYALATTFVVNIFIFLGPLTSARKAYSLPSSWLTGWFVRPLAKSRLLFRPSSVHVPLTTFTDQSQIPWWEVGFSFWHSLWLNKSTDFQNA